MKRMLTVCAMLGVSVAVQAGSLPFPVGEELTYNVTWNGIPVAWSKATASLEKRGGREILALRVKTRTFSFFDRFYRVDDFHESLVDPQTLLPIQYTKNLKEGDYRCHEITRFDHKDGVAHYAHQVNGTRKTYPIDANTRDLVSFMYFLRSEMLQEKSENRMRVMADEQIYDLIIHAASVKDIDLPNYKKDIPSLQMVPEAMFDGLFVRKGKATVWVSRDPRRLMTFAKVKVPFGRVRIKLQDVNGPGHDFWILEKKDVKKKHDS